MKSIYDLVLLEETYITDTEGSNQRTVIKRVPGGWIFTEYCDSQSESNDVQTSVSSVFVPYSDEFKVKKKSEGWAKS